MIAIEVIAAVVVDDLLPYFSLLVMGDSLIQDVVEPVPRAPPQPVHKLFFPVGSSWQWRSSLFWHDLRRIRA
jgi:hypothetical protein